MGRERLSVGKEIMSDANRLSAEDQARVNKVIYSGVNQVERGPFRIWRLLLSIWGLIIVLGLFSYALALWHGVV